MQLDLQAGTFEEMWQWTVNNERHPTTEMNAQGYNVNDGIAYGIFTRSSDNSDGYLCRFSHVQNSAICLCKAMYWGNGGTITRDGTFYLAKAGATRIAKLANVHSYPYPPNSPVDVSTLSSCESMTEQFSGGRGTGGELDVSSSGLTLSDMEAAYGGLASNCLPNCYMKVWGASDGKMTTWLPGGQSFVDFVDFEYGDVTYLIGLGTYDGSVMIIKLDGVGGGDITGFAYSRVVVDYTGSTSAVRTMYGFGAGCAALLLQSARVCTPHATTRTHIPTPYPDPLAAMRALLPTALVCSGNMLQVPLRGSDVFLLQHRLGHF